MESEKEENCGENWCAECKEESEEESELVAFELK
jgi:hypothetical protein